MARSKTSQRWLKEHFDDPYVKMAQRDGYRSRASYKLLEIQEKDRILRTGMTVVSSRAKVSTSTTSRPGKCSTRYRCASPCRRVIVRGNSICSHAAFAGNRLE